MDLHIEGAVPTEDERAAVDGLLGPPESGWVGGVRDMERDGRTAAGGLVATADILSAVDELRRVRDVVKTRYGQYL